MPHLEKAPAGLAGRGERIRQDVVQSFPGGNPRAKLRCRLLQLIVAELLPIGFLRIDAVEERAGNDAVLPLRSSRSNPNLRIRLRFDEPNRVVINRSIQAVKALNQSPSRLRYSMTNLPSLSQWQFGGVPPVERD